MAGIAASQTSSLRPEGVLGVDRASELRKELLEAFASSSTVVLNLEAVSDIDVACLQVLYAARKSAVAASLDFVIKGSLPPRSLERLHAAGFLSHKPDSGSAASPVSLASLLVDFPMERSR
jgi:anti-anti-sigma regulatory factor